MDLNISNDTRLEPSLSLIEEFSGNDALEKTLTDPEDFKRRALQFSRNWEQVCLFNNTLPQVQTADHDYILALGEKNHLCCQIERGAFGKLRHFTEAHRGEWIFGYFTYDLKNDLEALHSSNADELAFPALHFFVPQIVLAVFGNHCFIKDNRNDSNVFADILATPLNERDNPVRNTKGFQFPDYENYIRTVHSLKEEIQQGNIYEINYCREVTSKLLLDPASTFEALMDYSPAPFSCFYRNNGHYLISASPERFLKKQGSHLTSQPMKGTAPRKAEPVLDEEAKKTLQESIKERAENVMIVDLVRNDLSKVAKTGSVRVEELFGVYSYPHVHQMISTIGCDMREDLHWVDAVKACFPMGSMTGAPKLRAMELIEKHETFKRGLFSGSVGFVTPSGNFDFNVVIRSILYNEINHQTAIRTGSAITALSDPHAEWEECELKARALMECLRLE